MKKELDKIAGDNFNYIQLYFEKTLPIYTKNIDLWTLYIDFMEEKLKVGKLKEGFYRRAIKNCSFNY